MEEIFPVYKLAKSADPDTFDSLDDTYCKTIEEVQEAYYEGLFHRDSYVLIFSIGHRVVYSNQKRVIGGFRKEELIESIKYPDFEENYIEMKPLLKIFPKDHRPWKTVEDQGPNFINCHFRVRDLIPVADKYFQGQKCVIQMFESKDKFIHIVDGKPRMYYKYKDRGYGNTELDY